MTKLPSALIPLAFVLTACASAPAPKPVADMPVQEAPSTIERHVKDGVFGPASLTITVTGIDAQSGFVSAALYDAVGYESGGSVQGVRVPVSGQSVSFTYENLPAGEYGIKLFHDVNGNGDMDANAFGLPLEPYAFSNNAKGMMGPAKWEQAKFTVTESGASQTISFK